MKYNPAAEVRHPPRCQKVQTAKGHLSRHRRIDAAAEPQNAVTHESLRAGCSMLLFLFRPVQSPLQLPQDLLLPHPLSKRFHRSRNQAGAHHHVECCFNAIETSRSRNVVIEAIQTKAETDDATCEEYSNAQSPVEDGVFVPEPCPALCSCRPKQQVSHHDVERSVDEFVAPVPQGAKCAAETEDTGVEGGRDPEKPLEVDGRVNGGDHVACRV
ncbi:hypothetical protein M409DRAFT_56592 [Zasmidium cellare ATCC 36951]|uniref:Uncharacterized protein n=1 Tax=Zasmidium cellare ATCC 36951 TaxID=1080233 RepID=A0A6A6CDL8_ZASCE|nr:uncharacterized protein M409DRAFT_56592 [Zasmidium cellare ATCC 36951]KAF2164310.1 hypothetical protein M409DRAFT_56592 [Zasmidium cellare ATCC 36951]